jgi:hypothetical protein
MGRERSGRQRRARTDAVRSRGKGNDYRMSIHLILVVPGLLGRSAQALAQLPSLPTLAALSAPPDVEPRGMAAALVGALGGRADMPIAPLAALGAGLDAGADHWVAADPVLLAADRDDLVLVQPVDDLRDEEAAALVAALNRHFGADGLQFVTARPDAWFTRCTDAPDIATTPLDVAQRHGVYPYLPRGPNGATWRRWQNEIGMLLHDHPVNQARESAGAAVVTGIWFSGAGRLADIDTPMATVTATSGRIADVANGIARHGGGAIHALDDGDDARRVVDRALSGAASTSAAPAFAIVVLPADDAKRGSALEPSWLAPSLAMLNRSRIAALSLVADGNGTAARWTAVRAGLWRRVVAAARSRRFDAPMPVDA